MTTDQLAAVIHLRDLGYAMNKVDPRDTPVVPYEILIEVDQVIAQERMRQRLGMESVEGARAMDAMPRDPDNRFHSVHADVYDLFRSGK